MTPQPLVKRSSSIPTPRQSPPVILVVEDDDDNRLMLKTLLEMKGYRVVQARDGQEASEVMEREPLPHLLLVDLQLPRLNGFALARRVRQHARLSRVPIVVVSGHDPAQHRKLAMAAGCDEYLLKPIDFDRLEEVLQRLLPDGQ